MGGLVDVREAEHHRRRLHHRSHRPPSRCRDESYTSPAGIAVAARDRASSTGRDHSEGLRRDGGSDLPYTSPVGENSFTVEYRRRSSKKGGERPIRALLDEEMTRETETRRQSPSVIARLMGLDSLPPPQLSHKQQKELPAGSRKPSSLRLHESGTTGEEEEFKDVFEVMESSKSDKYKSQPVWKKSQPVWKGMPVEKEFNSGRHKFVNSKHPRYCEELNDALDGQNFSEDRYPRFIHEPNSLSSKHLNDVGHSPLSSHPSLITILRSSRHEKSGGNSEVARKPERKAEKYAPLPTDINRSRRPMSSVASHSMKEYDPGAPKLSKSRDAYKSDTTRIVILKPSLEMAQEAVGDVPLTRKTENLQFDLLRHRQYELSSIHELHDEGRERRKLCEDSQVMNHKTKGTREIAREITDLMKLRHIRDERSRVMSSTNNSEAYQRTSDNFDDRNMNYHPTTSYESSVSREARKRLSERWNMTRRFHEAGISGSGSGTLREMLALCDLETPRTSDSFVSQKMSAERYEVPRSTFVPAPSVYGNPKPRSKHSDSGSDSSDGCDMLKEVLNFEPNDSLHGYSVRRRSSRRPFKFGSDKPQSFHSTGEENKLPVREIHVNNEETRDRIRPSKCVEKNKFVLSENSNANAGYLVESTLTPESLDMKPECISTKLQAQEQAKFTGSSINDQIHASIEETSDVHFQETSDVHFHEDIHKVGAGSPVISKEAEQPSPSSVLEPVAEEEAYSSQCFEKISAGLQGIRMQLELLKLESEYTLADDPQILASDEETVTVTEHDSVLESKPIQQDGKDRDFSYLLDVLVISGIHGVEKDRLLSACYLPDYPVDPAMFEKLETKYGAVVGWVKSERKLLFDHINSILAEILAPCMDLHPWAKSRRKLAPVCPQRLADEVWRVVLRQRKELCVGNPEEKVIDTRWIEVGDYVDMMGREIEKLLKDELLEELVSELFVHRVLQQL